MSKVYGNISQEALEIILGEHYVMQTGEWTFPTLKTELDNYVSEKHPVIYADYSIDDTKNYFKYFTAWTDKIILSLIYDSLGEAVLIKYNRHPPAAVQG